MKFDEALEAELSLETELLNISDEGTRIRRRTRVVGAFPDDHSALMLVAAQLRYIGSTKWDKATLPRYGKNVAQPLPEEAAA